MQSSGGWALIVAVIALIIAVSAWVRLDDYEQQITQLERRVKELDRSWDRSYWRESRQPRRPESTYRERPPSKQTRPVVTPAIAELPRSAERIARNGGSAVVLLTPDAPYARNRAACVNVWDLFSVASLQEIGVGLRETETGQREALRPLYWLTRGSRMGDNISCDARLDAYDFNRARELLDAYGIRSRGPVLLVASAENDYAAAVNLEGRSPAEIERLVRAFRDGFAYENGVWDPDRREAVEVSFARAHGGQSSGVLSALSFVTVRSAAVVGCRVGGYSC